MAKKKNVDEIIERSLAGLENVDAMFEEVCEQAKSEFGSDAVFSGGEEDKLAVCLAVPSLSVRWLLQQEGLPLSRFIMLIGEQESFKSSFTDEVIGWHRRHGRGGGVKIEVESKDWPELRQSILQYDMRAYKSVLCSNVDGEGGWMPALSFWIQKIKSRFQPLVQSGERKGQAKADATGRIAAFCFVIDSLMSGLAETNYDKIDADGAPKMSFPVEARKISDYLKVMPKWIRGWPMTVIGINHKKVNKNPDGTVTVSIPGGKSLKFHESMEIDMRRIGREGERIRDREKFVRVSLETTKNSTSSRGSIEVEVVWWFDEDDRNELGQPKQRTIFDWHSATIELLSGFEGGRKTEIDEIVDLHLNRDTRRVWSDALGIPEKKPVRWREAGAMLEERPDLLGRLYDVLGIRRRVLFKPGLDFLSQWDEVYKKAGVVPAPAADVAEKESE